MKIEIDIEKFLENIETYAMDEEYDYTYYLISYKLQRMQITKMIGKLKPEHMSPILLLLRDWMPGGWVHWSEKTEKRWQMGFELCKALNNLNREFNLLDNVDLMQFDVDLHGLTVMRIFETINNLEFASSIEAIATVTSKIIHLLNPNLFVMWDTRIIKFYSFQPNGEGYLEFLTKMKKVATQLKFHQSRIVDKTEELRKRAAEVYGEQICSKKSLAKLIDENNWIKTRRPRSKYHSSAHTYR